MSKIEPVGFVYSNDDRAYYPCGTGVKLDQSDEPRYDQSAIDELRGIIERLVGVLEDMGNIPCWPNTRLIEEAREILK
jgi:hypothetical protein